MSFDRRTRKAIEALRSVRPEGESSLVHLKSPAPRSFVKVWASGLCALAIGAAFLVFAPTRASAIERMERALASVRTYHVRYFVGDTKASETWREGAKVRWWGVNTADSGCDGKLEWTIHFPRTSGGRPVPEGSLGYAMVTDEIDPRIALLANPSAKTKLQMLTESQLKFPPHLKQKGMVLNGEHVTAISIEGVWKQGGRFRDIFYCREDDTPIRVDYYYFRKEVAVMNGYELYDYPDDIPDSVFAFSPPEGMPILDHVKARRAIRDGVAGKTLSATADGVTINVLGAFQEKGGGLYVLWSGGATPHVDCTAAILDSQGKGYDGSIFLEEDDRNRPRNLGKLPKGAAKPKLSRLGFDRPYVIRPLSWVDGKPIYALHTYLERSLALKPADYLVRIPICKLGPVRVLRPNPKWAMYQSSGQQVGVATFKVSSIPIENLAFLLRALDPKALNSWGSAPLKMESVDMDRKKRIQAEHLQ